MNENNLWKESTEFLFTKFLSVLLFAVGEFRNVTLTFVYAFLPYTRVRDANAIRAHATE